MQALRLSSRQSRTHCRAMEAGRWRSSSDPIPPKASCFCPGAGWSSVHSHGWAGAAASPKTGSAPSKALPHGPPSPASECSTAESQDSQLIEKLLNQALTPEQGYQSARLVALAHLGSLKRALGELDRVTAWLRVFAMVNVAPGFNETPRVTNGYSDLINELFGPEVGAHARSSIGMMIPLNAPVNCEAEVDIDGG